MTQETFAQRVENNAEKLKPHNITFLRQVSFKELKDEFPQFGRLVKAIEKELGEEGNMGTENENDKAPLTDTTLSAIKGIDEARSVGMLSIHFGAYMAAFNDLMFQLIRVTEGADAAMKFHVDTIEPERERAEEMYALVQKVAHKVLV